MSDPTDENKNEVEILFKDEAEAAPVDLPPPGYERNEELTKRTDALEEQGEKIYDQIERESIDPESLEEDRDLQHLIQDFDMLTVSDPEPGFVYCWTFTGRGGYYVWDKKAQGWEVVQGEMKESKHAIIKEDTTRRIGDVILMRTTEENFNRHEAREIDKRKRQIEGVKSEVLELGRRHPKTFIVHEKLDGVQLGGPRGRNLSDIMQTKADQKTAEQRAIRKMAAQQLDPKIREGTVPGVQMPK